MNIRCQIVIPARLASTRLPEKLLRRVAGKSILEHTHAAASQSSLAEGVTVAVDDPRLAEEVERFGGKWIMTNPDCASGTDRIAEVAAAMSETEIFINVQGDEPEIDPQTIDRVGSLLLGDPAAEIATAGTPIRDPQQLQSSSCVKIVLAGSENLRLKAAGDSTTHLSTEPKQTAEQGRAVYFSRAAVPFDRDGPLEERLAAEPPVFWHHLGLYAYRREFLNWFAAQPPSQLEQIERLEQLRAIEAGKKILVARVDSATPGIDTQADLDAFAERYQGRSG